jgi:hypothetical protein
MSLAFGATYTYETKADWDNLYDLNGDRLWGTPGPPNPRPQIILHYVRFGLIDAQRREAQNLIRVLGYTTETRLLIYHCGFCWIADVMETELGLARVVGVQPSAYIQTNKTETEDVDYTTAIEAVGLTISSGDGLTMFNAFRGTGVTRSARPADLMDETLEDSTSRNTVRTRLGGQGYEVLTYQILSSLTDAEVIDLGTRLGRSTNGRIVHEVFVGTDTTLCSPTPCFTFRSIADLKALLPTHGFINAQTMEFTP